MLRKNVYSLSYASRKFRCVNFLHSSRGWGSLSDVTDSLSKRRWPVRDSEGCPRVVERVQVKLIVLRPFPHIEILGQSQCP